MLRTWRNVTLLRDARTRALSSSSWTAGAGAARRCGTPSRSLLSLPTVVDGRAWSPSHPWQTVWVGGGGGVWGGVVQLTWGLWCLVRRRALAGWLFRAGGSRAVICSRGRGQAGRAWAQRRSPLSSTRPMPGSRAARGEASAAAAATGQSWRGGAAARGTCCTRWRRGPRPFVATARALSGTSRRGTYCKGAALSARIT